MLLRAAAALFVVFLAHGPSAFASLLERRSADVNTVTEDLHTILKQAELPPDSIEFEANTTEDGRNEILILCKQPGKTLLRVTAAPQEWGPAFYYGLQKLGFLFPHPRIQISPAGAQIEAACGSTYEWRPRLEYRGFHLHTVHPNEWVFGFLGTNTAIGEDTIRWLARNSQNVLQVNLLRTTSRSALPGLRLLMDYRHGFGIHFGVAVTFAQFQQKHYLLIPPLRAMTGVGDEAIIESRLQALAENLPFDFLTANLGTTEFTPTPFERTLGWIEAANRVLKRQQRRLFVNTHVSTGQTHSKFGNFNFLPQFSDSEVGILVHTVMFYGLTDANAPVYGRRNFADIDRLMIDESAKRPVWYFPETSYFVAMDIDVPLFLTDYLVSRSADFDHVASHGIAGHLTFTSGQELGYWLMDWTVALLANAEYEARPTIGLELLGEDSAVWDRIIRFQNQYIKQEQLIASISSTTPLDEVASYWGHGIHERSLLRDLGGNPERLGREVQMLEEAIGELPSLTGVRNEELRVLLQVTWNRIRHAYYLRKAIQDGSGPAGTEMLRRAEWVRLQSASLMADIEHRYQRYPEAQLFDRHASPTSYDFGYAWPAKALHFWRREESMVRDRNWNPFFMNIYNLVRILM
ncbi:MAG: hypothetical protein WD733_06985 [Bryobacterales bacterium]